MLEQTGQGRSPGGLTPCTSVTLGKAHATFGKFVNMGCIDPGTGFFVSRHRTDGLIVRKNVKNVGPFFPLLRLHLHAEGKSECNPIH